DRERKPRIPEHPEEPRLELAAHGPWRRWSLVEQLAQDIVVAAPGSPALHLRPRHKPVRRGVVEDGVHLRLRVDEGQIRDGPARRRRRDAGHDPDIPWGEGPGPVSDH